MLKLVSIVLLALLTVDTNAVTGTAGQDCTPFDDDYPGETPKCFAGDTYVDTTKIECGDDFDCCLCESITCSPDCDGFIAGGDNAAFWVPEIIIDGNDDSGAEIVCDGDKSCFGGVFTGTNIKGVKCGGDRSCKKAIFDIQCIDPCDFECDGTAACRESNIKVKNVESVSCDTKACYGATIKVIGPDDDFNFDCGAEKACTQSTITINNWWETEDWKIKSFDCCGYRACKDAVITINNNTGKQLVIEEITCDCEESCVDATIIVTGDVVVENCECTPESCEGLTVEGFTCNGLTA